MYRVNYVIIEKLNMVVMTLKEIITYICPWVLLLLNSI